ncbi:MAG: hypothetical protein IJ705_02760 [Oscillospiraceae bacterium]|nr:hypothetical protein [Oscillospiraceae bacterium]
MDFSWIGSVNQYAKTMARQTQWKLKKQSGDLQSHQKGLGDFLGVRRASSGLLPDQEEQDGKLSAIMTKAEAGKKLSQEEWDYLRVKNPQLYAKLREIEREQENYEKALRRCKTRDEAQRLHVSKLGEILQAAKDGDESARIRLSRVTQSMTAFTESREFRELPTEAEEACRREEARQERVEALQEEAQEQEEAHEAFPEEPRTEPASPEEVEQRAEDLRKEIEQALSRLPFSGKTEKKPAARREAAEAPAEPPLPHGTRGAALRFGQRAYTEGQDEPERDRPERKEFRRKA